MEVVIFLAGGFRGQNRFLIHLIAYPAKATQLISLARSFEQVHGATA